MFLNHLERIVAIKNLRTIDSDTRAELETTVSDVMEFAFYEALFSDDYSYIGDCYRESDGTEIPFGCFIDCGNVYWIIGDAPIQTEDSARLLLTSFFKG